MGHSDSGSSAKVILRNKRRGLLTGDRPWSVSGLPQLMAMSVGSLPTGVAAGELSQFSISESALHQLASPAASTPGKAEGLAEMMASSSTVEESVAHTTCAGSSSGAGSLRRRKMRSRKRTQSRRCDSGSDGVYPLPDSPAQRTPSSRTPSSRLLPLKTSSPLSSPGKQQAGGIVKSGSFSATPPRTAGPRAS
ncbi:uncharacterized protein LOC117652713 [Thrips palmi]|uniref:Uncharacterized protein LOC117652713 n=1 Tax=Thrips palmi TaxID=161013 RepID=A0A6P9ACW5_THRPL|nr:uncharacterized protein LOC117652713 [Thrips palmi]